MPFGYHVAMSENVVIITGASRGIGAATAKLAARRGYAVCVNYATNRDAADRVATEITKAGGRAITAQADVAKEADVLRLFDAAAKGLGPVTALVNNAGILEQQMRLDEMEAGRFERVFATNITGAILWLLSSESSYSTGTFIDVSGGR